MKYDHVVKVNGVFYPAGQEVPNGKQERVEQKPAPAPVEKKDENAEKKNTTVMPKGEKDE